MFDNDQWNTSLADENSNGSVKGQTANSMAEAFNISGTTAFAIVTLLSVGAVAAPFLMNLWAVDAASGVKALTYVTMMLGFYMAWNIGANDVANAMGTSVGSGALSLSQAVMIAAVLEFSGAFLVGSHVSDTMQHGIVSVELFADKAPLLLTGMLSSLAAAGTWLQVMTKM